MGIYNMSNYITNNKTQGLNLNQDIKKILKKIGNDRIIDLHLNKVEPSDLKTLRSSIVQQTKETCDLSNNNICGKLSGNAFANKKSGKYLEWKEKINTLAPEAELLKILKLMDENNDHIRCDT